MRVRDKRRGNISASTCFDNQAKLSLRCPPQPNQTQKWCFKWSVIIKICLRPASAVSTFYPNRQLKINNILWIWMSPHHLKLITTMRWVFLLISRHPSLFLMRCRPKAVCWVKAPNNSSTQSIVINLERQMDSINTLLLNSPKCSRDPHLNSTLKVETSLNLSTTRSSISREWGKLEPHKSKIILKTKTSLEIIIHSHSEANLRCQFTRKLTNNNTSRFMMAIRIDFGPRWGTQISLLCSSRVLKAPFIRNSSISSNCSTTRITMVGSGS